MARKFWTLLPEAYYTHKQLAKGGRNEILFATIGNPQHMQEAQFTTYSTHLSIANLPQETICHSFTKESAGSEPHPIPKHNSLLITRS